MKCPNCKFISSNKRDVCPECLIDLRPHKQALGIPISKAGASIQQIRAEHESDADQTPATISAKEPANTAAPKAPAAHATKPAEPAPRQTSSSSWLSKLFGKKAQAAAPVAPERPGQLTTAAVVEPEPTTVQSKAAEPPTFGEQSRTKADPPISEPAREAARVPATAPAERSIKGPAKIDELRAEAGDEIEPIELPSIEEEVQEEVYEDEPAPLASADGDDDDALDSSVLEPDLWQRFLAEMGHAVTAQEGENGDPLDSSASVVTVAEQLERIHPESETAAAGSAADQPVEVVRAPLLPETDDDEPLFPNPIDPIESFAKAIEAGLQEATAAAEELTQAAMDSGNDQAQPEDDDDLKLIPKASAQPPAPTVTPEVLEFDDEDDALLEQQLDELIGDLIVDVAPVKEEKKSPAPPQTPETMIVDDDLEISFEFEVEGEENEGKDGLSQVQTRDAEAVDDLLSAFNELDSAAAEIATAASIAPDALDLQKQQQVQQAVSEAEARSARLKQLSVALGVSPDDLLKELTEIVIEAHGLNPADLAKHDVLGELERELDEQLENLVAEGTTFYALKEPEEGGLISRELRELQQEVEQQVGEPDQASALEAELEQEIEALAAEGMRVYSDPLLHRAAAEDELPAEITAAAAEFSAEAKLERFAGLSIAEAAIEAAPEPDSDALREPEAPPAAYCAEPNGQRFAADNELLAALEALSASVDELDEQDRYIDLGAEPEEPAEEREEDERPSGGAAEPAPDSMSMDGGLWQAVASELNAGSDDSEIGPAELFDFKPEDRLTVLFDMVEDEVCEPGIERILSDVLPTSTQRKVDASDLTEAFSNYEREERVLAKTKQAAALAAAAGELPEKNPAAELPAAKLSRRVCAAAIDLAASGTAALVLTGLMFGSAEVRTSILSFRAVAPEEAVAHSFMWIGLWGAVWIIASVFMTLTHGQTFGQRLTKTQVVDEVGGMIALDNAIVRALGQFATLMTLGIGFASAFGKTRQALHDKLSRTVVTTVG